MILFVFLLIFQQSSDPCISGQPLLFREFNIIDADILFQLFLPLFLALNDVSDWF